MRRVVPLFLLVSLAFSPAPFPKQNGGSSSRALKAIQGNWVRVKYGFNGEELPSPTWYAEVRNSRISYGVTPDWLGKEWYPVTIDAERSPKRITIHSPEPLLLGLFKTGRHNRGIYKLEGDKLTICFVTSCWESSRPAEFTSDCERHLQVWMRTGD
jgi:uncharacterized protein (TIGR03067 family)